MTTFFALPQPGERERRRRRRRQHGLGAEHVVERHAHQPAAADAQDIAPGDAEMGVAEVFAGLARDAEHNVGGWGKGVNGCPRCPGLVIEEEFRGVDQRPHQILGSGETAVGHLLDALR